jgi:hypothetical protein
MSKVPRRPGRHPRLIIVLELEQPGQIVLDADTYEDQRRVREWLRRSRAFQRLPEVLERFLDDLDTADRKAA